MRTLLALACEVCGRKNYTGSKNKTKATEKIRVKKYCRFCRKHSPHKETKV
ncbi:MAG: 50S ribosomal protein L33 [Nitrospirae bacterium]|nr:50S ribosomal protein L33 [Nitrospirota bacterium]